jgi:O-antigen ligase
LIISIYFVRYSSNKIIKIVSVISILFCAVALYFSSSKGSFLSLFFMLACMAVIEFINSKSKLKLGLIYATVLSLIVFSLKENPRIYSIKQMVVELIHPEKADPNASSDMSNGQRIYVIKSSIEVIKSNFWVGVGAGDVIDELEQKYITNNYQVLAKKKLNCHNQFLESFVEMGLLGGFIFLILNVVAIIQSIKNKNQLQLYFIIGFSIIALTESFLNHQAGVVFFALFLSIFSILNKNFLKVHEKNSNHNRS